MTTENKPSKKKKESPFKGSTLPTGSAAEVEKLYDQTKKKPKWHSPFGGQKLPSREFIQTLHSHGVGLSKAFCERLRKEKRFQLLYDRAKEHGFGIYPNIEKKEGRLAPSENLIYIYNHERGEAGYLRLKEFIDEFIERVPTGRKQDSRNYVV